VALVGVVIIAHPAAIFGSEIDPANPANVHFVTIADNKFDEITTSQRFVAIVISMLGVLGASGAYTMIRMIGNRAHALISVNYFAVVSTLGSAAILLFTPGIAFTRPEGVREWILLAIIGVLGFVLQFLLTSGLQLDKSSKATGMLYTQIIFALLFDWGIWGILPTTWSIVGGIIVMASTLWAALQKPQTAVKDHKHMVADEESPLLGETRDPR
jgi:drug/metabolite transporter (DMT)-like permease